MRVAFAVPLFALGLVLACSGPPGRETGGEGGAGRRRGTLSLKGSDTMVILGQRWAEGYMRAHEDVAIQVSGGGSGTGIAALLNGTTDIAAASRPMSDRERAQLLASHGVDAHETAVALDALAVYVDADNPIASLTIPQLEGIYRGQISHWRAVGGPDRRIVLYSRENNSGTYAYFKEHVLDDYDFAATTQTLPGTAAVMSAVSLDPSGIGYGGIGYATGVRAIPIAAEGGEPVEPTMENATSGRYPLARFLFVYTAGEPSGAAAQFIAWILSPAGQAVVPEAGFYPLPLTRTAAAPGEDHSRVAISD